MYDPLLSNSTHDTLLIPYDSQGITMHVQQQKDLCSFSQPRKHFTVRQGLRKRRTFPGHVLRECSSCTIVLWLLPFILNPCIVKSLSQRQLFPTRHTHARAFLNVPIPMFLKQRYYQQQQQQSTLRTQHGIWGNNSNRKKVTRNAKEIDNESDDFLGDFDDDDDDDDDDEQSQSIGNTWVLPSKLRTTKDGDDTDDGVADFFFEDDAVDLNTGTTEDTEKTDTPIYFDVGIDGRMMETGPLSMKMYNAIQSRNPTMLSNPTLRRTIYELILKTTAKQAVKVTLQQSGLQLDVDNDLDDNSWGIIESIRTEVNNDNDDEMLDLPLATFDSWDSLLSLSENINDDTDDDKNGWIPGKPFSFVLWNVPTLRKAVSMDALLSSLDPDGSLRNQALDAGILNDQDADDDDDNDDEVDNDDNDEMEEYHPVTSLKELFEDNYRRVEQAPHPVEAANNAYTGTNKGGYRVIHATDLLNMVNDINLRLDKNETITASILKQYRNTTMHVMDAFVSHGCLLVDVTDDGTNPSRANSLHQMWQTTESFYQNVVNNIENHTALPSWETVSEAGSVQAKVGYQSMKNGTLSVLETRQRFNDGEILPVETKSLFGAEGYNSMRVAFDVIAEISLAAIQIAVGASTLEIGLNDATIAMTGASRLVNELVDNGKPLLTTMPNIDQHFSISMSPHRILQYGLVNGSTSGNNDDAEIFGAHTDTTFITAVPVASVAGLEVYDDAAQLWYRPELAVQQQQQQHKQFPDDDDDADIHSLPWYTRYIILMPGELLQISTGNEVPAAVHRVIDGSFSGHNTDDTSTHTSSSSSSSIRYSAPVLLRGRSGVVFDCERYFGIPTASTAASSQLQSESSSIWPVWSECQDRTMDQIYSSLQGRPDKK